MLYFFVLFVHLFSCIYLIENYVETWCVLEGVGGREATVIDDWLASSSWKLKLSV